MTVTVAAAAVSLMSDVESLKFPDPAIPSRDWPSRHWCSPVTGPRTWTWTLRSQSSWLLLDICIFLWSVTTLAKINWENILDIDLPLSIIVINYNNFLTTHFIWPDQTKISHACEEGSERDNNYDKWIECLNTMRNELIYLWWICQWFVNLYSLRRW